MTDLRLIPSAELGRPRIDIVVQTSGQLRDVAASRLELLTKAIALAAQAKNDTCGNYVVSGTMEAEKLLVDKGFSPKEARELSMVRSIRWCRVWYRNYGISRKRRCLGTGVGDR